MTTVKNNCLTKLITSISQNSYEFIDNYLRSDDEQFKISTEQSLDIPRAV
uniref:Uncharacterized protein n=1 Tax=Anguilla anguilla TaxID=7936 RepID=A0A0E9WVQ0_ANGAN